MAKLLILRKCTFVLATVLAAAETPLHAQACPQMEHTLAGAKRARYLQLTSARMNADAPGKVHISHFLESGSWSVVFAKSPASERAVFFFHLQGGKPVFADTWGGVAAGDSAETIAAWTKTLEPQFPQQLAMCFARLVETGE